MPAEGEIAPEFTLPTGDGGSVSLHDYRGKQPVIVYFYPKDDTTGCTAEACSFRDNLGALARQGVAVLGISPDSVTSHAKFAKKFNLTYPLLSDEGHKVADDYEVWVEKSMYGRKYMGIERSTFLVDKDGKIQKVWRKVNAGKHVLQLLDYFEKG